MWKGETQVNVPAPCVCGFRKVWLTRKAEMRSERPDLTAGTSAEAPSHKFTRANDFTALSALLRNFYAPSARDRETLLGVERRPSRQPAEQPIAHFASSLDGENSEKRKESFAWRKETFRIFVISH
jgi:hypothetical protein